MGCAVCVGTCPAGALEMKPLEEQTSQQKVFDYMVQNVAEKPELFDKSVKGSQFRQPQSFPVPVPAAPRPLTRVL